MKGTLAPRIIGIVVSLIAIVAFGTLKAQANYTDGYGSLVLI